MDVCQTKDCVQHYAAEFENQAENRAWDVYDRTNDQQIIVQTKHAKRLMNFQAIWRRKRILIALKEIVEVMWRLNRDNNLWNEKK
jgi:hypothetical protein